MQSFVSSVWRGTRTRTSGVPAVPPSLRPNRWPWRSWIRTARPCWCRSPRSALVTPLIGPPLPGLVRLAPVLPAAPGWWPHHRRAVHHSV